MKILPEGVKSFEGLRGGSHVLCVRDDRNVLDDLSVRDIIGGSPRKAGHWVVLVLNGDCGKCELFDCLGVTCFGIYKQEIEKFVKLDKCHFVNDELLDIKNCGYFCVLFCWYKSRGYNSFEALVEIKKFKHVIKEKCEKIYYTK